MHEFLTNDIWMTMYQSHYPQVGLHCPLNIYKCHFYFSSPELKVQVGFLDCPFSAVFSSVFLSTYHKVFSPEKMGQIN